VPLVIHHHLGPVVGPILQRGPPEARAGRAVFRTSEPRDLRTVVVLFANFAYYLRLRNRNRSSFMLQYEGWSRNETN
jgi:hypothetical protein